VLLIVSGSTVALARGSHVPPSAPIAALVLATVTRSAREAALGMRERLKLRRAFSGYVSPDVMDDILSGEIAAELGGVNRFVCALFSDIRGYTTRSEGMSPQEIVAFLNSYFEQVVNVIHARGGTVVTFMGDGIMAVFGAPKALDNPCAQAFDAARGLLDYVQDFNAKGRAAGVAPIEIGVGLHAGDAVVGHVGSSSRHDYTAIGDVINVASRLEGVTKEVGYRLVYSGVVAQALAADAAHTHLGFQQIKGHTPVEAYGFDRIG
jgi:adenylate cyclase